jgi:pyruvate dehydrogenase E2 component (dihydrolipoamide acetyltransferase)
MLKNTSVFVPLFSAFGPEPIRERIARGDGSSWWRLRTGTGIHLGVAVSLRGGLVASAVHDAAGMNPATLISSMRDLVRRQGRPASPHRIQRPDHHRVQHGRAGRRKHPRVIYLPQVALVGYGRIVERPWAIDGLIGVRPAVTVSLAATRAR